VEFLVDTHTDQFYFLEMNARIQVEHPVTEALTGVDLVAEQIAIASGAGIRLTQSDIRAQGWAMECRINAEDPGRDFQPSPGVVRAVTWPAGPGIRVDTHIAAGSRVPPFYDSLLAKLIAFHAAVLKDPEFQAGAVDTGFLARLLERSPVQMETGIRG
jgi:acetyl-CoA carboxylase biotin carboxylase subunit